MTYLDNQDDQDDLDDLDDLNDQEDDLWPVDSQTIDRLVYFILLLWSK